MQSLEKDFYFDTLVLKTISAPSSYVIWWNHAKLYKMKAPKERERKRNKGKHQSPGKQAAQTKSYCLDWDAIVSVQILNTTYFEFFFVVA
jgi:hypothetical protein